MEPSENAISVIVCCYNSASRLPETIRHLIAQKTEIKWELLLIDNASTDNTKEIAKNILDGTTEKIDYRIIDQPEKGLAKAREKGIESSKYPVLIFCDDDNHFENDYLEIASKLMMTMPETGILGGLSKPKLAFYPGKWIEDMYPAMAIGARANQDGYVNWVFGAGMVIRKKIFSQLKEKKIEFLLPDRIGNKQTAGGDNEWCELTKFLGYKIYYTSNLVFYHYMQTHRLQKGFFLQGHGTVYSTIYLWLLSFLISNKLSYNKDKLYRKIFAEKANYFFHFFPRVFLGQHRFYSALNLYHLSCALIWLLLKKKVFNRIYMSILSNLGIESETVNNKK